MMRLRRALIAYLIVGFALSVAQNLGGLVSGGLSAFVWAGSLSGTVTLLVWWFLIPALIWPLDLFWTLYHAMLR